MNFLKLNSSITSPCTKQFYTTLSIYFYTKNHYFIRLCYEFQRALHRYSKLSGSILEVYRTRLEDEKRPYIRIHLPICFCIVKHLYRRGESLQSRWWKSLFGPISWKVFDVEEKFKHENDTFSNNEFIQWNTIQKNWYV